MSGLSDVGLNPNAETIDASGCEALTAIDAPNAVAIDARWCKALTAIDMTVFTLDKLQHSEDRTGPWKLYIYEPNSEYHNGGVWFEDHPKYPEDGEITTCEALTRCITAVAKHRQIRVCDGGDLLVFHFDGRRVVYGKDFWNEVCP